MHILLVVPSTDYSLSVGNFWGILASQGLASFSGQICVYFTRMNVEFAWLCVWQSIVFIKKKFFRYCEKKLHFGVKIVLFFLEIPVFLRIFWSGVVGAIDTFVAEHVANMLSWLK